MSTSRFIVCRASAGSGKTYTLVRQFIEIAISTPSKLESRFSEILAITFTNKAANGMKDRIMNTLADIVAGDEAGLVGEMATHLLITPDEVVHRCMVLRGAILHHYSEFSVCTIDSFVHRLVRTFAHDLGLPMNFNVQIDEDEILQTSVENLLALAGTEGEDDLTQVLSEWVEDQMEEGKSYNVENTIKELAKELLKEATPAYLEQLKKVPMSKYTQAYRQLRKDNNEIITKFKKAAQKALDARGRVELKSYDFSNGVKFFNLFELYARGDMKKLNESHKMHDNAVAKDQLYIAKCPPDKRDRIIEVTPEIFAAYGELLELEQHYRRLYNTRELLMNKLYSMAVLGKVSQLQESYSRENEVVHISEFNKRVAQVVAEEPAPFIYERIGTRYHNYLIDEFQDTSRLQWLNMLPLLDEAMTYEFRETAEAGTHSLVVGDGKQAIYRFRQGDVRQFMMLPEVEDRYHGKSLVRNYKDDPLTCNYRTLQEVVEFNNFFFEWAIRNKISLTGVGADILPQLYLGGALTDSTKVPDLRQQTRANLTGGYVQIGFYERSAICSKVRDIIRHQVDDLGYHYRDIYILAHYNDTLIEVSNYLSQPDDEGRMVPLVSSESFVLYGSRVVHLLRSLLAWLDDRSDRLSAGMAVRLYAEIKQLSQADTDALMWRLRECAFDLSRCFASLHIDFSIEQLHSMSLYDCVEQLLRLFHLEGCDSGFVATLLGIVNRFAQNQRHGIGDLVRYLDEKMKKLSSSTSPDMDAVQLFSIHKAKGLEAPVVIYVDPQPHGSHPSNLWVELDSETSSLSTGLSVAMVPAPKGETRKETAFDARFEEEYNLSQMDRMNLLYVALTRPMDKLFVVCEPGNLSDTWLLADFVNTGGYSRMHPLSTGESACGIDHPFKPREKKAKNRMVIPTENIRLDNVSFPNWESRIVVAKQHEDVLTPMEADPRRYGIMVHDILSRIVTVDDVDFELERYSKSHHLSSDDSEAVRQRMVSMLEKDEYRIFFDGSHRVACEMPMVINGQKRRPDRVVFGSDTTWVIDFKTGVRTDELDNAYQQQVQLYADALALLGYPNVQPVLIYL